MNKELKKLVVKAAKQELIVTLMRKALKDKNYKVFEFLKEVEIE